MKWVDVPGNFLGYQFARNGEGYAGIITFNQPFVFREYISVELKDPLLKNRKYCVEFYVSLADSATYTNNSLGVYFSNISLPATYSVMPFTPQIANPSNNLLNDKENWVKISGDFIAAGGEQHLTIGNFNPDTTSDTAYLGGNSSYPFAYCYIDDVSVYECGSLPPSEPDTLFLPNVFTPNGDGENDVFSIGGSIEEMSCSIFNRWAEQVATLTLPNQGWDGRVNGMECSAGVYFYLLTGKDKEGREVVRKGSVTLYR